MSPASPTTSLTLLDCLRRSDQPGAWERFVRLYTPLLHTWAHRQRFHDADIADVTQEVLIKLLRELPEYDRGAHPSFRGWLFTVATNQGCDFRRRKATRGLPQADGLSGVHNAEGAPDAEIEEAEFTHYVIHRARELIRKDFDERTWLAFTRHRLEGVPVPQVATELGMPERTVYRALNKVLTRLRHEIGGFLE